MDRATRPVVLAISRQLGSGGAFIGQHVARRLGMKYVDREILQEATAQLGADESTVEALEERADTVWSRIARFLVAGAPDAPYVPPPPAHLHETAVMEVESRIIREIAGRESAVIVGRGAAHFLRERPYVVRLFVHAPEAYRIAELQRIYDLPVEEARETVKRADRDRARFIAQITGRPWVDATQYDLTVDTSLVSIEVAAEIVSRVVEERRNAIAGVLDDDSA